MKTIATAALLACTAFALPGLALADAGHKVKPYVKTHTTYMPTACAPSVVDKNGNVAGTGTNHARPCVPVAMTKPIKPCKPMVVDAAGRTQGVNTNHARPCETAAAQ